MRATGAVSPSVISALSSGAQPSNSAATRAVAAEASVKSIAGDPVGGAVQLHVRVQDVSASRCATIPLSGVSAYMAPTPTASAAARCFRSASWR